MATVHSEILISREDDGISERFRHANEASIGKAHRNVGVLRKQLQDWFQVFGKFEADHEGTAAKQCAEIGSAALSQKVERLRKNRFARTPNRRQFRGLGQGPWW